MQTVTDKTLDVLANRSVESFPNLRSYRTKLLDNYLKLLNLL